MRGQAFTYRSNLTCHLFCVYFFIGKQPCFFIKILTVAVFIVKWHNRSVATKKIWPTNLKYLLSGPLQKILANLCSKSWSTLLPSCSLGYLNLKHQSNYTNSPLMRAVFDKSLLFCYGSLKICRDQISQW